MTDNQFTRIEVRQRTFDLIVNITGAPLVGPIEDWPSEVQDAVYAALEIKSKAEGLPLFIDRTGSDIDPDTNVAFIHIVCVGVEGLH